MISFTELLILFIAFISISYFRYKSQDNRANFTEDSFKKSLNKQLKKLFPASLISNEIFWVGDEHRTHPWSQMPGGCTVVVVFTNDEILGYDKVKRPHKYMKKIIGSKISTTYSRNDNIHIKTLQEYVKCVCITKERGVYLKKVWDNEMAEDPWDLMKNYATK